MLLGMAEERLGVVEISAAKERRGEERTSYGMAMSDNAMEWQRKERTGKAIEMIGGAWQGLLRKRMTPRRFEMRRNGKVMNR